ncbi:class I SAM-dependent methyltransferase [Pseudoflavonifractor sp. MSJ-30]|nr:class I SAM-dependent methyltransferase [Pseudoflavonifractor sp. MSJ-30]
MKMRQNFWQESWKAVNRDRIAEYGKAVSPTPDKIIGILQNYHAKSVCDAGCGCGIYAAKLLASGFTVDGFDLSTDAVEIAREHAPTARLKTAEVCSTGYPSGCFDAIVCRDVLDHIGKQDAELAIPELLRILKPGGILIATLDAPDEEYCREPHAVNADGDFVYTGGKWTGMVFHPYSREEIMQIIPPSVRREIMEDGDGFLAVLYHGNPDR